MSSTHRVFKVSPAALHGVRVLAGVDAATLAGIAGRCTGMRYAAGATVVSVEDPGSEVYFILSGTLRANIFSSNGKEVAFRDQHAGELFGEISAIDGHARSANVTALDEVSLAMLPRDDFLDVMCGHPTLAHNALGHLAFLVRSLSERVVEFSTLGVRNRIHSELLRLALATGARSARVVIEPPPRHGDVANRVSTHREAVTRELAELERSGLVERDRSALVITDLEALRVLVAEVGKAGRAPGAGGTGR